MADIWEDRVWGDRVWADSSIGHINGSVYSGTDNNCDKGFKGICEGQMQKTGR